MKLNKIVRLAIGPVLTLALLAIIVSAPGWLQGDPALAAPEAQKQDLPQEILVNTGVITSDTNFAGRRWLSLTTEYPTTADIYWSVDVGTVNTTTLTLQVAPYTAGTWTNHISGTIETITQTDKTAYVTVNVQMPYFRVQADVTNSNSITPVIWVTLR